MEHINFLSCPSCNNILKIEIYEFFPNSERIKEGALLCSCGLWYPVINGVPRLLIGNLRNLISKNHPEFLKKYSGILPKIEFTGSDELQERTAYAHDVNINFPNPDFKNWDEGEKIWIEPLTSKFYKNKVILDAGCRVGVHTYFAAKFGAKLVIGIDIGNTVEIAYEVNREMNNVLIVQADLHNIPSKQIFDFIYCLGVLHHLPEPKKGFFKLIEKAKPGSHLLIWVYRFEDYQDLKVILFLRNITIHLNPLSVKLVSLLYAMIYFVRIKFYNLKSRKNDSNTFFHYLNSFKFGEIHRYIVNQLYTPIAYYYKKEELEEWFKIPIIKQYDILNMLNNGWKVIVSL